MGKKKQAMKAMKRGGPAKKRGGGMMKKDPMAMGGNVSPRKAMAMGMKKGGKVMKGKKKKAKKGKKRG
jgi:hypothetical protein